MEMGLNAAPGDVDQQSSHKHLGHGRRVPRYHCVGITRDQKQWKSRHHSAEHRSYPDMEMNGGLAAFPGERRTPKCEENPRDPL